MGTLPLIQKRITSIGGMRLICFLSFFVLFASLQQSLGRRPKRCGVGFELSNESLKGRIFKMSSITHAKCAQECLCNGGCRSYEFSSKAKRCILMSNYSEQVNDNPQEYIFCKRKSNAPRSR